VLKEEEHTVHICVTEPACAQEVDRETRAEAVHEVRNGMQVRRGEGAAQGVAHDRTCWGA